MTHNRDPSTEIIEAFHELILEKGYNSLSIRELRDKANVAMGTIYHHFPGGKIEILRKFMVNFSDKVINVKKQLTSELVLTPNFTKHFIMGLVHTIRKYYESFKAINIAIIENEDFEFNLITKEYYKEVAEMLQEKFEDFRQIPQKNIIQAYSFINHTCNAYIFRHMFFDQFFDSDEDLISFLANLIDGFFASNFKVLES